MSDTKHEQAVGPEIGIRQTGVPYGLLRRRTEQGFVLSDGTVLLESERDESGRYKGGAGMDGMYLSTGRLYKPLFDGEGSIRAFQEVRLENYHNNEAPPSIRDGLRRFQEEAAQAPTPADTPSHNHAR